MLVLVSEGTRWLASLGSMRPSNTRVELGRQSAIKSCWCCLITVRVMQRGGFGQLFRGKKPQDEEEEEEEDSAPQNPLAGLFGGAKKAKVCRACFPNADWAPVTRVCCSLVQRAMHHDFLYDLLRHACQPTLLHKVECNIRL